jgi:hypothetical protein
LNGKNLGGKKKIKKLSYFAKENNLFKKINCSSYFVQDVLALLPYS